MGQKLSNPLDHDAPHYCSIFAGFVEGLQHVPPRKLADNSVTIGPSAVAEGYVESCAIERPPCSCRYIWMVDV